MMNLPLRPTRSRFWASCMVALVLTLRVVEPVAAETQLPQNELIDLPIEQLLDTEVTSVTRQPRRLAASPAAVYVLTQEDIRRSAATTIPEALRLVPGVQVARVDRDKWAITARGFNDLYANKLLVLIDGRSVYTPLFSGVWWDSQDTLLEDIERIEIIRGPGASLWGSNAVNGVINIITKHANSTQGGLLTAAAGDLENGMVGGRYGGRIGDHTDWRVYGKYFEREAYDDAQGRPAGDDWRASRGGFRLDSRLSADDQFTLSGDIFSSDSGGARVNKALSIFPFNLSVSGDQKTDGFNVLSRWKHRLSDSSNFALQMYFDDNHRSSVAQGAEYEIQTFDMDFQHDFLAFERHRFIWGAGYRYLRHETHNSLTFSMDPAERQDNQLTAFLQDEIALLPDRLSLTLGSKFEHRETVGFQVQPNIRLLWTPDNRNSLWAAISRAVRLPSWSEQDGSFRFATIPPNSPDNPLDAPALNVIRGNRGLKAEELIAYELGYRTEFDNRLSADLALFYNDYARLRIFDVASAAIQRPGFLEQPFTHVNDLKGQTYGAELSMRWDAADFLRFRAGYSLLKSSLRLRPGSSADPYFPGRDPQQQFFLHSSLDMPYKTQFDLMLRYVDDTPELQLNSYVTLDVRLAWKPVSKLELAFIGRNLGDPHHYEFRNSFGFLPTQISRDFFATLRWSF